MKKYSVRVFLEDETFTRLCKWADYHGLSLSRACRVIIDSAPLYVPADITIPCDMQKFMEEDCCREDIKSVLDD